MKFEIQKEKMCRVFSYTMVYVMFFSTIAPYTRAAGSISEIEVLTHGFHHSVQEDIKYTLEEASHSQSDVSVAPESRNISKQLLHPIPGEDQPETNGSTANISNNMVDKFTGNLSYSVELANLEGFPITIAYDANVGMMQEASWVGLGWNLSLGSVNRDMRGVPDDFEGDKIVKTTKMKDNIVTGGSTGVNAFVGFGNPVVKNYSGTEVEPYGKQHQPADIYTPKLNLGLTGYLSFSGGKYENNYTGKGSTLKFGLAGAMDLNGIGISTGLGMSLDNQNGIGYTQNYGFQSMPSMSGFSLGGYHYQKSINSHSRSGVRTINNSSGWKVGLSISGMTVGGSSSRSKTSVRTYGVQTFVPRIQTPGYGSTVYTTSAVNISISNGLEKGLTHYGGGLNFNSDTTTKGIINDVVARPAFGYMNYTKGNNNSAALLDFNRVSNTAVSTETKLLSFSAPTYDIFFCNAPGLSSSYRAYRYDVVEYHDPIVKTELKTKTVDEDEISEMNFNIGQNALSLATAGATWSKQKMTGITQLSTCPTDLSNDTDFNGITPSSTYDGREYYLHSQGEIKPTNNTLIDTYQGFQPSKLDIQITNDVEVQPTGNLLTKGANPTQNAVPSQNTNQIRNINNIHYREYRIAEIDDEEPTLYTEEVCAGILHIDNENQLFTSAKLDHHIGKLEVTDAGGFQYEFGIPSYSYEQNEVSFSASGLMVDDTGNPSEAYYNETGMAVYGSGDNSVSNARGRHESYEKTMVPAHASSFLLTKMTSSDYIDRTGDGPSADDQGNYYKINYTNPYNQASPFIWRSPMCSNVTGTAVDFKFRGRLANLNKGFHTDPWDDMASYAYGKKDLWYPVSVESKNLIAVFCLEDREDQYSMIDENGGLDLNKPGKLLHKIKIYSKNDLLVNPSTAVPLQIVEFVYDYSLCQGYVGNSNSYSGPFSESGKLTLKAIYTYSGKSGEKKTVPVEFTYSSINPEFEFNSSDRWGNYKPNYTLMPNHEVPYTDQTAAASTNIEAWKLVTIDYVGAQKIDIEYDVDTYSHVQNQRAMRMFNIAGMSSTDILAEINNPTTGEIIYTGMDLINNGIIEKFRNPNDKDDHYNVIYFRLEEPIENSGTVSTQIKQKYFTTEEGAVPDMLYFNLYAKMGKRSGTDDLFEYVETVVKLGKQYNNGNYIGVAGLPDANNKYHYGWVIVEPEDISQYNDKWGKFLNAFLTGISPLININLSTLFSEKVNPLQIAVWQHGRLNVPCTIYGEIDYSASAATDFCDYAFGNDINIFGANLYKKLNKNDYGLEFEATKSFIRLFEPDSIKVGGGHRVKSITINDNWNLFSGEYDTEFVYNYDYTDKVNTSSGVASYEPQIGGNENPFYQLTSYDYSRYKLPDEKVYQKDPWGEMVYPSPVVGYGSVVSTLFDGTLIGKTMDHFHTAYEHPIKVDRTEIKLVKAAGKNAVVQSGLITELFGFTQGFYVQTNDFHGKVKRNEVYGSKGELISSTELVYFSPTENIRYIGSDGSITESVSPKDIDIYIDNWKTEDITENSTISRTWSLGFTMLPIGPAGASIPVPLIGYNKDNSYYRYKRALSAFTFNKVVHTYSVSKQIITSYLGSKNTAQQEFYDIGTGNPIVSSVTNEFDDKLFSVSYPARWYYDNFNDLSTTDGAFIPTSLISGNSNVLQQLSSPLGIVFHVGDELEVTDDAGEYQVWVLDIQGTNCYLIDENGDASSGINWSAATIRINSGVKNLLGAMMMNVTTKNEPTVVSGSFVFPDSDVLGASASLFAENKEVPCIKLSDIGTANEQNYPASQLKPDDIINPFLQGVKGNYRMLTSASYQDDRTSFSAATGIRQDGTYLTYDPFYALSNGVWYSINESGHPDNVTAGDYNKWRILGEATRFDEFGKVLESRDQVDVNEAILYGMNPELKLFSKASVVNALATEIGFDGFEDYGYMQNSTLDYLNYGFSLQPVNANAQIVSDKRHSGVYSLKVSSSQEYIFDVGDSYSSSGNIINGEYEVETCNCLLGFAPTAGASGIDKEYFFSTWIHEETTSYPFQNTSVVIELYDGSQTLLSQSTYTPDGVIIDGWQKIEGKYSIPSTAESIKFRLVSTAQNGTYFDDFRTHPYVASMTTTVYDQLTLLPIAEHDPNNFTTFYNYDENNQLVRTRIETATGISTISESEAGTYRKQ